VQLLNDQLQQLLNQVFCEADDSTISPSTKPSTKPNAFLSAAHQVLNQVLN
jgi:hypothetical protein